MWQQGSGGIEAMCGDQPSAPRGDAVYYAGRRISRRVLLRQKEDCARALVRWGVSAGEAVLLCTDSTPERLSILLALWKLGAVPHLLNPDRTPGELGKAIRRSGARLLLISDGHLSSLETVLEGADLLQVVVVPKAGFMSRRARRHLPPHSPSEAEALPFKDFLASGRRIPAAPGVILSHDDLAAVVWQGLEYDEECRFTHGELAALTKIWEGALAPRKGAFFGMLPTCSLSGLPPMLAALRLGVPVLLEPDHSLDAIALTMLRERPPWGLITPALWRGLWEQPRIHKADLGFLEKLWVAVSEETTTHGEEMPMDVFFPCSMEIIIV